SVRKSEPPDLLLCTGLSVIRLETLRGLGALTRIPGFKEPEDTHPSYSREPAQDLKYLFKKKPGTKICNAPAVDITAITPNSNCEDEIGNATYWCPQDQPATFKKTHTPLFNGGILSSNCTRTPLGRPSTEEMELLLVGLVAPWGGFVYHEVLFHNLSDALSVLSESTGNALIRLSLSLSSLANKVMANRLALDFLLAKRGVCAVINKTCCTYINNTGVLQQFHIKMMVMQVFQPLPDIDPTRITAEVTLGPLDKTGQEFCGPKSTLASHGKRVLTEFKRVISEKRTQTRPAGLNTIGFGNNQLITDKDKRDDHKE
ncbi:hypothetical protein EI555_008787, partial [Monodon monoceros]